MKKSINNTKLGTTIVAQRITQKRAKWFYEDFFAEMNHKFGTSRTYLEDGTLYGLFLRPVERTGNTQLLYSVVVNGMQCQQWNEVAMQRMEWLCFDESDHEAETEHEAENEAGSVASTRVIGLRICLPSYNVGT